LTHLVDFFRRGDVARDIRLLAAQGALAPKAVEQLGLLALLVADTDPEIARTAEETLAKIPHASLTAFLARSEVSTELRNFFAARGVEPDPELVELTTDEPLVDETPPVESVDEPEEESRTVQRVAALSIAKRISLAMKGTREERSILIRDPNKIVAVAVLSSPKMTDTEIENIAKMGSVSDEILRLIANTRTWTKNYQVVLALARNAKTPLAVSMNLLPRLTEKDLRMLSADRNVPDVLRITARKKVVLDD
jgi:hypothetical protein